MGRSFNQIPRVGGGRLALSGVPVRAAGAGRGDGTMAIRPDERAGVVRETPGEPSLRDGRVPYESPWNEVRARSRMGDTRIIPIAGRLALLADVPQGPCTLQVSIAENQQGRRRLPAAQWVDLDVQ